jgi:periplasmic protein CpxP/Spy
MTTRRKIVLGVSAVLVAGLIATPFVFAHPRGGMGCGLGMGQMARVFHDLDLTAEQKDALHRIHDATRESNAAARAALHDGFVDAARILLANPQNVAGARATIDTREAALDQIKENAMTGIAQALAVLTPEQRAKLAEHLEEHAEQLAR